MRTEFDIGDVIKIPMRIIKIEVHGKKPEQAVEYVMILDEVFPLQKITLNEEFIISNNLNVKE